MGAPAAGAAIPTATLTSSDLALEGVEGLKELDELLGDVPENNAALVLPGELLVPTTTVAPTLEELLELEELLPTRAAMVTAGALAGDAAEDLSTECELALTAFASIFAAAGACAVFAGTGEEDVEVDFASALRSSVIVLNNND